MRKLVLAVACAVLAGLVAVACGPKPTVSKVVRVGAVIDRTGSIAGATWPADLKLATDQFNAALKAKKFKDLQFDYVINDSQNRPDIAGPLALEVRDQGVKAVIADTSRDDIEVNQRLNYDATATTKLPVVCFACNAPNINNAASTDPDGGTQAALRDADHWNFRMLMSSAFNGKVMVKMMQRLGAGGDTNGDGKVKVSFYAGNEPFGKGFITSVKNAITAADAGFTTETVLHPATVDENSYNWSADLAKTVDTLNQDDGGVDGLPDHVIEITSYPVAVTKAWNQAGYNTGQTWKFWHTQTFRVASTLQNLGAQAEGQSGQAVVSLDPPGGAPFGDAFTAATSATPSYRDSMLYDSAVVIYLGTLVAVQKAGLSDPTAVTPEQIRDGIRAIADPAGTVVLPGEFEKAIDLIVAGTAINYAGASGPLDFDANNNTMNRIVEFTVQGGQFVDTARYDCVASPTCPRQ